MFKQIFLFLSILIMFSSFATSAEIYKPCDIYRGFSYTNKQSARVGFLTIHSSPGSDKNTLVNDISVVNPQTLKKMEVFSVLNDVRWAQGTTSPLHFSGQISKLNKQRVDIAKLTQTYKSNSNISFSFVVYEYDSSVKKYYQAFCSEKVLLGNIDKSGGKLLIDTGAQKHTGIRSPENYLFTISIRPRVNEQQTLRVAVSETKKVLKIWK